MPSGSETVALREELVSGPIPRYEVPGWRALYGVVAGVTARGDGPGPGFDLGLWTGNPVGEVMSRWRAFRQAEPGFSGVVLGHQVHQAMVAWHNGGDGWLQIDAVDGHATMASGLLLTVTVADCIPVYLVAPKRRAIAILHSGWRGTAQQIIHRGIETLLERSGASADELLIHCGIGICGACYEVGREVMDGCGLSVTGSGPWHLDLRAVLAEQAKAVGAVAISTSQWCTNHDYPTFYSHRASGGRDGRMVAYLGMPAGRQGGSTAGDSIAERGA